MPRKGDFGLVRMPPPVGTLITLGEFLNGDGFTPYDHAFVMVDDVDQIVEAEVGGARTASYHEYDNQTITWSNWTLTDAQRDAIAAAALALVGTKYSVVDYLAIASHRLHLPMFGLAKRRVESTKYVICSQLVDLAYQAAGIRMFDDHRWPGLVTPASLHHALHGPVTA
jgi:uncharacterized protein YycO